MKVGNIVQPFLNQINKFIKQNKDKKVGFFYLKRDDEYHLIDIENSYFHHDDDGQIILRINDFDDDKKAIQQVYKRANRLTVEETLSSLKNEVETFLQTYKNTEYYIEEECFGENIFISICDNNTSGIPIDPINKANFIFDDNIIILQIK